MARYERAIVYTILFLNLVLSLFLFTQHRQNDWQLEQLVVNEILLQNDLEENVITLSVDNANNGVLVLADKNGRVLFRTRVKEGEEIAEGKVELVAFEKDKVVVTTFDTTGFISNEVTRD